MTPAHVKIVQHPLVARDLAIIREGATPSAAFRQRMRRVAWHLTFEATRALPTSPVAVETPLEAMSIDIPSQPAVAVPILRAGLGLLDGFLDVYEDAQVVHLGYFRDEEAHTPVRYYGAIPADIAAARVFVLDPMLATGGTVCAALDELKAAGAQHLSVLALVSAPEGCDAVAKNHPGTPIFTAALDRALNDQAYIVPGLGDAGDRLYNT